MDTHQKAITFVANRTGANPALIAHKIKTGELPLPTNENLAMIVRMIATQNYRPAAVAGRVAR